MTTDPNARAVEGTDTELHRQLVSGDRSAGAALYERHRAGVERAARNVIRDHQLAEDVAQEVFAELLLRPDRADPSRGPVAGYLRMVARRRAIDTIRSLERSRARENESLPSARVTTADPALSAGSDVRTAVARLPRAEQAVIHLAFFSDRTYRECAAELGVAEGTAKSRIRRALRRLREDPNLAA